jgi:type IV pilus assembly protein PilV
MKPVVLRFRRPGLTRGQQGVALLETLIAILIFAFGVLGIVGLQTSMTRAQTASKFRGDASYLASELMGTMWSDIPNLAFYETASGACDGNARCLAWKTKVAMALPGGTAVIEPAVSGDVTITINWAVPGEGSHRYQTRTTVVAAE